MSKKAFERIFRVALYTALVLPILNLPPFFSPPHWGKTLVLRLIVSVILAAGVWRLLSENRRISDLKESAIRFFEEHRNNLPLILLFAFFLWFTLAGVFSPEPTFSFWGSPTRAGGLVTLLSIGFVAVLAFFTLREKEWKTAWNISLVTGVLVSFVALLQWQGVFEGILVTLERRPTSTLGSPIALALYLLLLASIALPMALREKQILKKAAYAAAIALFVFVILIAETRAVYLGLLAGLSYFALFFPSQSKMTFFAKGAVILTVLAAMISVYLVNKPGAIPKPVLEHRVINVVAKRLNLHTLSEEPRFSAWRVGLNAIQERPIFGYGPENFSVAFDKYYDPDLPDIQYIKGSANSWWDRAHNIFIDTASQAGIPALLIYSALILVLFWQLQRVKRRDPGKALTAHGIQTALLAYLVSNFFSFDVFSTLFISFLLIAYALFVVRGRQPEESGNQKGHGELGGVKTLTLFAALLLALWFNWAYVAKPLSINAKINDADTYLAANNCPDAIPLMEKLFSQNNGFLNSYVQIKYATLLSECAKLHTDQAAQLTQKTYEVLKEAVKTRPTYTRNWTFLGTMANIMLEQAKNGLFPDMTQEDIEHLRRDVEESFTQAQKLSPKRQEVILEWIKADLVAEDFEGAKQRAEECISLHEETPDCWWFKGLTEIFLGQTEEANLDIQEAKNRFYDTESENSLRQILRAYLYVSDFEGVVEANERLVELAPGNVQYRSALATSYREVGQYAKAREQALRVLELQPESREVVEAFLRTLPF